MNENGMTFDDEAFYGGPIRDAAGLSPKVGANLVREFADIMASLNEQHRQELEIINGTFNVAGSFVYDVERREEGGETHPFLRIRQNSKTGIGEKWVSRVDNTWERAWDNKGNTIVANDIFVDEIRKTKHGQELAGYHYVAIPLKTDPDRGKITVLLGPFAEDALKKPKQEAFDHKFELMKRWAWDTGVAQSAATEAKIQEAFNAIPLAEFFTVAAKGLFDKYIQPLCCS